MHAGEQGEYMDLTSVIGLVLGFMSLIVAFVLEGGSVTALLGVSAGLIVFGGTIGATIVSFPGSQLKTAGSLLKIAFMGKSPEPLDVIDELVKLATTARREGILSLEDRIDSYADDFFKNGLRMIVDGVDPDLVKSIMETELSFVESRHEAGAAMFEAAGGYSPTMGILGTVMGLIHVLGNLSNVSKLGPLIATAFIATLYGVGTANLVWLPIANKLKQRSKHEVLVKELTIEGILSIQAGENPTVLRQKLTVFLAPKGRERRATSAPMEGEVVDA